MISILSNPATWIALTLAALRTMRAVDKYRSGR
jgi:hypothetical protein